MKSSNSNGKKSGSKTSSSSNSSPLKSGGNPNYPSATGNPSGKGRGNSPKK